MQKVEMVQKLTSVYVLFTIIYSMFSVSLNLAWLDDNAVSEIYTSYLSSFTFCLINTFKMAVYQSVSQ